MQSLWRLLPSLQAHFHEVQNLGLLQIHINRKNILPVETSRDWMEQPDPKKSTWGTGYKGKCACLRENCHTTIIKQLSCRWKLPCAIAWETMIFIIMALRLCTSMAAALLLVESQFVFNYSTIYAGSTCMYVCVYTLFILVLSYHRPAKPVWIEELDDQVRCAKLSNSHEWSFLLWSCLKLFRLSVITAILHQMPRDGPIIRFLYSSMWYC